MNIRWLPQRQKPVWYFLLIFLPLMALWAFNGLIIYVLVSPAVVAGHRQIFWIGFLSASAMVIALFGIIAWVLTLIVLKQKRTAAQLRHSNALNESLLKAIPFAMAIVGPDQRPLYQNDQMKTLLTKTEDPTSGGQESHIFKPQPSFPPTIPAAVAGTLDVRETERAVDGRTFLVNHTDLMYQGQQAELEIFQDITERKRAERALAKSQQQLQALFNNSLDAILLADDEARFIDANASACAFLGYRYDELLRLHLWDLMPALDRSVVQEFWQAFMNAGQQSGEYTLIQKDGNSVEAEYRAVAHIMPGQHLSVLRDITERKRVEQALKLATDQAESANQLKSEFLARMSHEFRTPLQAILGFANLLLDEQQEPAYTEKLRLIIRSGTHLLQLIDEILDFSHIETDAIEIQRVVFDLRGLFEQLSRQFALRAGEHGLEFRVELAPTVPALVQGDKKRLTQALTNILDNALKFTQTGQISLRCHYTDDQATIRIHDTGIGIARDKQKMIFSPFEQIASLTTRPHGGTGLGLPVAKGLIELMGGRIHLTSRVGEGSQFTVTVPLPPAYTEPDESSQVESAESTPQEMLLGEQMVQRWSGSFQDDPMLQHLLFEGIAHLPNRVRRLRNAATTHAVADVQALAHALKGVSGNLGMTEIYETALELEQQAGETPSKPRQIERLVRRLEKIVDSIPHTYLKRSERQNVEPKSDELRAEPVLAPTPIILVVEDDEINGMLIQELLSDLALSSDLAANGKIALDMLRQTPYRLLLLDMQMPVMDGFETIKRIRGDEQLQGLYVVALTAHSIRSQVGRAVLASGCDDYLAKPIQRRQFRQKISTILEQQGIKVGQPEAGSEPRPPDKTRQTGVFTLDQEKRQTLQTVIQELKANDDIFDPGRVYTLADQLADLLPLRDFQLVKTRLYSAADRFDDRAIGPIVQELEEMERAYQ